MAPVASTSEALRFLAGARAALQAGAFDAAHANATVTAVAAARAIGAERELPAGLASALEDLTQHYRRGVLARVNRDDATAALRVAARITKEAARRGDAHSPSGPAPGAVGAPADRNDEPGQGGEAGFTGASKGDHRSPQPEGGSLER